MIKQIARSALAAFVVLSAASTVAQAQLTVYTSRTAFQSALGAFYVDPFTTGISTLGASVTSDAGSFGSGVFNDRVVRGGAKTTWTFAQAIKGFGGDFDLGPAGYGQGLEFFVSYVGGGTELLGQELGGCSGCFFGFTSSASIASVEVRAGTQPGVAETYNFDNMTTADVPEPASFALVSFGMVALGAVARRRYRV